MGAKKACGQETAKRPSVLDKKVVDRATALQRNESGRCAVESRYEFRLRRSCTGGVAVKRGVYCIGDKGYVESIPSTTIPSTAEATWELLRTTIGFA